MPAAGRMKDATRPAPTTQTATTAASSCSSCLSGVTPVLQEGDRRTDPGSFRYSTAAALVYAGTPAHTIVELDAGRSACHSATAR